MDQTFHATIAKASGNAAAAKVIQDLHMRTCIFDHRVVPERFIHGCEEHLAMLAAMRDGRRDEAAELMDQHLDHARDAIFTHIGDVQTVSTEKVHRT